MLESRAVQLLNLAHDAHDKRPFRDHALVENAPRLHGLPQGCHLDERHYAGPVGVHLLVQGVQRIPGNPLVFAAAQFGQQARAFHLVLQQQRSVIGDLVRVGVQEGIRNRWPPAARSSGWSARHPLSG